MSARQIWPGGWACSCARSARHGGSPSTNWPSLRASAGPPCRRSSFTRAIPRSACCGRSQLGWDPFFRAHGGPGPGGFRAPAHRCAGASLGRRKNGKSSTITGRVQSLGRALRAEAGGPSIAFLGSSRHGHPGNRCRAERLAQSAGGSEVYELAPGDSIAFRADEVHAYENPGLRGALPRPHHLRTLADPCGCVPVHYCVRPVRSHRRNLLKSKAMRTLKSCLQDIILLWLTRSSCPC
jgi:hypothetical protein